jgi:hypothetical protein
MMQYGCDLPDKRLVNMATESARRQAEQSREMLQLQQQVAEGTKQLVSAEAESRREWIELKRDIEREATEIGRQRDILDAERRATAAQRYRDPIITAAIESASLFVACLTPLIVAWYALHVTQRDAINESSVVDMLVAQSLRPEVPAIAARTPPLRL